jgi:hypothetical protein
MGAIAGAVLDDKRRVASRGGNPEILDFHLSAFLSAARSVTFVLQVEEKDKYDSWFPDWFAKRTASERHALDLIKTQRNLALKTGAPEVTSGWTLVPQGRSHIQWQHMYARFPVSDFHQDAQVGVPTLVFAPDADNFANMDVVAACCKDCVEVLELLVRDFATHFGEPAT